MWASAIRKEKLYLYTEHSVNTEHSFETALKQALDHFGFINAKC